MKTSFLLMASLAGLAVAPVAMAKNNHVQYQTVHADDYQRHTHKSHQNNKHNTQSQGLWQSVERRDHRDYRDERRYNNVRYVTQGYNQLPPGLQKNVARGKAIPPGWAKKTA